MAELPDQDPDLRALLVEAIGCHRCELWRSGTQTVFGEGATGSPLMLVGEQPGDREDVEGRPFVGPAGRLLRRALDAAGVPEDRVYLTNVVKHFRWTRQAGGTKRIHRKPALAHVEACRPWLDAEIAAVRPAVLVCLGSTAAQALLGRAFRVTRDRGKVVSTELPVAVMATVHPSSLLRTRGDREEAFGRFVADLRRAHEVARASSAG